MNIAKIFKAQVFAINHRGLLGFAAGLASGAGLSYFADKHLSRQVEMILTQEDAQRMLIEDSIAVFDTKYGPVFAAMQREVFKNPDGGEDDS